MIDLKCKVCGCSSTVKQWNKATHDEYGEFNVTELFDNGWEDCDYKCPKCGSTNDGDDLKGDDNHE